jgi:hypothetical protein
MTYFPIWIIFLRNKKKIKKTNTNVKTDTEIKDNDKTSVEIKTTS